MAGLSYRRRPERSRTRLWLSVLGILTAAAVLGGPVAVAYRVAHPPRSGSESVPPGEPVTLAGAPGGGELKGWYLRGGDRAAVMVHGYGQSWQQTGALAQALHRAGYSVLLYDQRGHGQSAGKAPATFGPGEAEDLVQAIELVRGRGARQVVLVGWDLGANVALKVAARRPEVGALVLHNPSDNPPAELRQAIGEASPLPDLFFAPYTQWMAALVYGIRPGELKPLQEAAGLGARPVLVIAPNAQAEGATRILHASGQTGTELFVATEDAQVYAQKVTSFLDRSLGQ